MTETLEDLLAELEEQWDDLRPGSRRLFLGKLQAAATIEHDGEVPKPIQRRLESLEDKWHSMKHDVA